MIKVNLHEAHLDDVAIEKFTVGKNEDWRGMINGRYVPEGTYTRLLIKGRIVMSDTPSEMRDHSEAVYEATGSCLINGLGIGMVLKNILLKKDVTDVTVIELNNNVIGLVAPYYKDKRVNIIQADAYEYQPPKGKRYNMVWHDIWNDICTDNLEEMAKLHRKYGRRCDWQGSWGKEICLYHKRKDRNYY